MRPFDLFDNLNMERRTDQQTYLPIHKGKRSTSSAFVMRVVKVNSPVVGLLKPKYPL